MEAEPEKKSKIMESLELAISKHREMRSGDLGKEKTRLLLKKFFRVRVPLSELTFASSHTEGKE